MNERTKQIIIRIRDIKGSGEASSNHVSTATSKPSEPSKRSINRPSNLPTNQPANQPANKPRSRPSELSQNKRLRPPLPRKLHREDDDEDDDDDEGAKRCFKLAKNLVC